MFDSYKSSLGDKHRSSLGDKTIECLICTQDWLRISFNPEKAEDLDIIAQMEKGMFILSLIFMKCRHFIFHCLS